MPSRRHSYSTEPNRRINMAGYIEKTIFKNGDIRYFINMKCIACDHEVFGFYEKIMDVNMCPCCKRDNVRTFNPDLE